MNLVDLGIVLLAVALAAVGYERGLVASALPLAGFLGGAALGGRIGPALLPHGAESQYAPIVAVATGVLIGAFAAVALDGVAQALRARALGGSAGVADGVGGAIVLAALALALCWAFGAVALHATGQQGRDLREAVQRSAILGALNDLMPPSGPLLHVLRRVDPTPVVRGPEADVPPADPGSADDPEVRAAGDSTVRVLGTACGLGVEGSGWVAAEGVVVTNAHVVAGEDDTTVTPDGGSALDATVVHYDIRNDLAILGAPGLEAAALDLAASTPKGADAAVIGYPDNGPLAFTPARLGRTGTVASQDSYGRGPVQRKMTPFRAAVRSGNSGGPVVDTAGDVLSTVFAATVGGGADSGLGVPNSVVRRALSERLAPADTGPCAA
ncbi:MAG TPA: MarP family serine protease [Solirubrobacterales bacterium]|nr:MarP family serine protease [Solirubrobacterales bacterium]